MLRISLLTLLLMIYWYSSNRNIMFTCTVLKPFSGQCISPRPTLSLPPPVSPYRPIQATICFSSTKHTPTTSLSNYVSVKYDSIWSNPFSRITTVWKHWSFPIHGRISAFMGSQSSVIMLEQTILFCSFPQKWGWSTPYSIRVRARSSVRLWCSTKHWIKEVLLCHQRARFTTPIDKSICSMNCISHVISIFATGKLFRPKRSKVHLVWSQTNAIICKWRRLFPWNDDSTLSFSFRYIATRSMILIMYVQTYATIRSVFSKASDLPITLERLNSTTYVYVTMKKQPGNQPSYWMFNFLYFTSKTTS